MGVKPGPAPSGLGPAAGRPAAYGPPAADAFSAAIADLTDRWGRGEPAPAESYLEGAGLWPADRAVELVYREYRLAVTAGLDPSKSAYLARFPEHRGALERLLAVDAACPDSLLGRFDDEGDDPLPVAGDAIGPYVLERELGEGGFARVFLARQADLADRPVVVKVTTRPTREPWLLARARHPNIVEVLTHAEVDDGALQLIAMPFLGGAALSAVLARRRSRPVGARPTRFLDDLDAAAAPEHRSSGAPGPSRAILRAMSDAEAFAWVAARLAEALDHARRRGVAHGDVKPSNVLIAADGTPMLLDFNLAQDWSGADAVDAGGTLAYMAPERLLALAGDASPAADDERAHRADVYALGMVLLESLTGWSPADGADPGRAAGRPAFVAAARVMAEARRRPAWAIRRAEAHAGRALPAGLRSILRHALRPDPEARYARGLELAEDLDRWRSDRPLAFAPEPSRLHAAARWARRRRRPLAVAAAGLAAAGLVAWLATDGRSAQARLGQAARHKYARLLDSPDSRALHARRPGDDPRRRRRSATAAADAFAALRDYDVVGGAAWRDRDDFARLPADERDDLELWLLEQALRYGRALARREGSPDDWRRARDLLDRACGDAWPAPMLALRGRLADRIADADAGAPAGPLPARPAVDAYLRGVDAEVDDEEAEEDADVGARRAAGFYAEALAIRPGSFWARYRAAVVAFSLSRWDDAADGLRACLAMRPANPVLYGVYGTCLMKMGREDEALDQCDRGIDLAPEHAELVQVRAFARAGGPELDALRGDILRYERLRAALPDRFLGEPEAGDVAAIGRDLPLGPRRDGPPPDAAVGPDELDARAVLASRILDVDATPDGRTPVRPDVDPDPRRLDLAAREVEKLLALDPSNFRARVDRMCLAVCRRRPAEAGRDLDVVLADPRLPEYARTAPDRLDALHYAACLFAREAEFVQAVRLARKLVELSLEVREPHAHALYTLAAVEGYGAGYNPKWVPVAAKHLEQAVRNNPKYEAWFRNDPLFKRSRPRVREAVGAIRAAALAPPRS